MAQNRKTGKVCAIKLIVNAFEDQETAKKIFREVQIMRKLSSVKQNIFTTKLTDIIAPGVSKHQL
jgi:serine/threonine protein kinase